MRDQFLPRGSSGPATSRTRQPTRKDLKTAVERISQATVEQMRDGYLNRLRRLLRLRRDHFEELNVQGLRLLDQSIFAAYCDLVDIGYMDAGKEILKTARLTSELVQCTTSKTR